MYIYVYKTLDDLFMHNFYYTVLVPFDFLTVSFDYKYFHRTNLYIIYVHVHARITYFLCIADCIFPK